ncbi:MAG: hypothetical protein FWE05_00465 [Defluviitaleaceae bacterium]|nr:hypothetical protein [Defluviitaleaceae bacterium]
MREFMILIGELIIIAVIQTVLDAVFTELEIEKQIRVVNIACLILSYFLLIRFVSNHFLGELTSMVNLTF